MFNLYTYTKRQDEAEDKEEQCVHQCLVKLNRLRTPLIRSLTVGDRDRLVSKYRERVNKFIREVPPAVFTVPIDV